MPQIEEARLGQLEEAAGRVPTLEAERDQARQRAEAAEAERNQLRLTVQARPLVTARLAEAEQPLPALAQARVAEAVLAGSVPTGEAGIDTEALHAAVDAAAAREAAYLRSLTPAAVPSVFGSFGSAQESAFTPSVGGEQISESDFEKQMAAPFGQKVSA